MELLNEKFSETFIPNKKSTISQNKNIFIIKDFFKYPDKVLDFGNIIDKWSDPLNLRPGYSSYLPKWCSYYILKDLMNLLDHSFDKNSFDCFYNFLYDEKTLKYNDIRSSSIAPHTDALFSNTFKEKSYVFLLNLNKESTITRFWKFKNSNYIETEYELSCYNTYIKSLSKESDIDRNILDVDFDIEYPFNTALLYQANLLHSPKVDKKWSAKNPRIHFRISYNTL